MAQYFSAPDVRTHFDKSQEPSLRSSDTSYILDAWNATKILGGQFCIRFYNCHGELFDSHSDVTGSIL